MTMDRFLVHQEAVAGPATHAIIIGVGVYNHLPGGSGPPCSSKDQDGMGQLSSPPLSARSFAGWLIESFRNPAKPLASVALLLSEKSPVPFTNPVTQGTITLEDAVMANTELAIAAWKERGDTSDGNLLLFFFCGHGISRGSEMALLLADYGMKVNNALDSAIDFHTFFLGMDQCAAAEQCFFIDACRASSDRLVGKYAGKPIVQPSEDVRPANMLPRQPIIYFSALAGQQAHARPGKVSVFTEALIKSFKGAGSDQAEGDWRVSTDGLHRALDHYERKATENMGHRKVQIPEMNAHANFYVHHLDQAPEADAIVSCSPPGATNHGTLGYSLHKKPPKQLLPPTALAWELSLPVGSYDFSIEFTNGIYRTVEKQDCYVCPPYRKIPFEVG